MGKRRLEIADIQDDSDIYDRLVIRQKARNKKPKKLADPYDETETVQLHERLKRLEKRTEREEKKENVQAVDEAPAIVESPELARERLVYSIANVQGRCLELLEKYEQLELHLLFADKAVNDEFKRYLRLVASGSHEDTGLSKIREALFVKVLKDSIAKEEAKKSIKERFLEKYGSRTEKHEDERDPKSIRRVSKKIVVPPILKQLLEE